VAKKVGNNTSELIKEGRGVKGTSIGCGSTKRSTMSKSQKRNYKRYKGQGR